MPANEQMQRGAVVDTLLQWWVALFWCVWFVGLYHGVKILLYWRF